MNKPVLLYIIDNLGRGGAETLLVGILKEVNIEYEVVLVTLQDLYEFREEELKHVKHYSLGFTGKLSYPRCAIRLKKIIRDNKPVLVHAHLLDSSIILRMACSRQIPIVISLHSILSLTAFKKSTLYRNLEKLLFRDDHYIIAVSYDVLKDYESSIGKPRHAYILENYVNDNFVRTYTQIEKLSYNGELRLVAVGNVRKVKNYLYMIYAFKRLKQENISLDIYGNSENEYFRFLQQKIDEHKLPIRLMGSHQAIHTILPSYHFFVMSSTHEGFGLAALEAMAIGLPLILSDIPVLRRVTRNNAFFFNLNDTDAFVKIIEQVKDKQAEVYEMIENGMEIVKEYYSKEKYTHFLLNLYRDILQKHYRGTPA